MESSISGSQSAPIFSNEVAREPAAGLQISNTRGPAVMSLKPLLTLHRLSIVIHQYCTAPIAEVVSALTVVKFLRFQVPIPAVDTI